MRDAGRGLISWLDKSLSTDQLPGTNNMAKKAHDPQSLTLRLGLRAMNRKAIVWTLILLAVVILPGAALLLSPLRWSEGQIQNWVLRKAPLHCSVADVRALIDRQGWKLTSDWQGTNSHASSRDYPYVRGGRILVAHLGYYQGIPWRTDVETFWGFDENDKLIDVHVRKTRDAL